MVPVYKQLIESGMVYYGMAFNVKTDGIAQSNLSLIILNFCNSTLSHIAIMYRKRQKLEIIADIIK